MRRRKPDSTTTSIASGGTIGLDDSYYVERQADQDLLQALKRGEFAYVLTSRQMGKSSLMVRMTRILREQGARVIPLDLTAIGQNVTPEQWYDGLITRVAQQVRLEDELDDFWSAHQSLGPVQRFFAAIQEIVLPTQPGPLIIFIDEIDVVRSLPFSTDEFFAAIRECYNRRAEDALFERLNFCLLGVATPADLIKDTRNTPFNVGRRIPLYDFTQQEARILMDEFKGDRSAQEAYLARVFYWTNGHPYLTRSLCQALVDECESISEDAIDQVCQKRFLTNLSRNQDDNLIFVRERLLNSEVDRADLLRLYDRVLRHKPVKDDPSNPLVTVLKLSGVVRVDHGHLLPRNQIYEKAFSRSWVRANMPHAAIQKAFRAGVIRAASISLAAIAVMAFLVLFALITTRQTKVALAESNVSRARALSQSGFSGQRFEGLEALALAREYYPDPQALRNRVIACLALVDIQLETVPDPLPANLEVIAANQGLTASIGWKEAGPFHISSQGGDAVMERVPNLPSPVDWVSLSPDERFLGIQCGVGDQSRFILWDCQTDSKIYGITNQVRQSAIDFSMDSSLVAIGLPQGSIQLVSLEGSFQIESLPLVEVTGIPREPLCIRLDPSGTRLAESSPSSLSVRIWDLESKASTNLYQKSSAVALAWSPDGNQLATASGMHSIYLWDLRNVTRRELPQAHQGPVSELAFSPIGNLLASVSEDRTLKLWTLASGECVTGLLDKKPSGRIFFNKDGSRLAMTTEGATIQYWSVQGSQEYQLYRAPFNVNSPFTSLSFDPESQVLVAANNVGAFLWDTRTSHALPFLRHNSVWNVSAHPDRGDLLLASSGGLFSWPRQVQQTNGTTSYVYGPGKACSGLGALGRGSVSIDGRYGAFIGQKEVYLVRLAEAGAESQVILQGETYAELALSPHGQTLAAWVEENNEIHLWEIATSGQSPKRIQTMTGSRYFTFSPDGQYFVVCKDRRYLVYRVGERGQALLSIDRPASGDPHGPLAFAPTQKDGGMLLAVAGVLGTIELYLLEGAQDPILSPLAHLECPDREAIELLAFSRDGRRLAASRSDQTVQVWNLGLLWNELTERGLGLEAPRWATNPDSRLKVSFVSSASEPISTFTSHQGIDHDANSP